MARNRSDGYLTGPAGLQVENAGASATLPCTKIIFDNVNTVTGICDPAEPTVILDWDRRLPETGTRALQRLAGSFKRRRRGRAWLQAQADACMAVFERRETTQVNSLWTVMDGDLVGLLNPALGSTPHGTTVWGAR